jgi:SulP family sulfate permease
MFDLIIKKPQNVKNDILSGITVALALVPEAIAFSFVAHVDPTIGLYAAFMMGLITAIFGGRPGMISGATGAVAVIFAPLVIQQTQLHGLSVATQYLFLAVILMGLLQIVFGIFRWGKFVRLIPHSVMLGFVNGLAIIIFKAQFSQFKIGGVDGGLMPMPELVVMGGLVIVTMIIIQFLPKLTKAVPATLVAIISVTGMGMLLKANGVKVYNVLDFIQYLDPTKMTIQASLPSFIMPMISLEAIKIVLPYAILAAAVGLIESLMTLTLVDELTETRGRGNKESIGQGLANVINGFFGGMGGCAMIGQSMINIRGGGRGRLSGISWGYVYGINRYI